MVKKKINNLFYATFIMLIMLIGVVSAFEFDNVKRYNPETKTVKIINAFGLGENIAEVKLNTPLNMKLPQGYQKIAEFEIKSFQNYNNSIKELELFDLKNGNKKFLRNYDLKVRTYIEIVDEKNTFSCVEVFKEGNLTTEGRYEKECSGSLGKSHIEESWKNLTQFDFKKNENLTIGIFLDAKKGDYVEWIPNLFGVRINEWASFTVEDCEGVGGSITIDGDYCVHTFLTNGTFNLSTGTSVNATILTVAGGGGGGRDLGGGGGAGGLQYNLSYDINANTTVTVGVGGVGAVSTSVAGEIGGNSSFGNIVAIGGGGGKSRSSGETGCIGGSGGGGAYNNIVGCAGISGQGYAGGDAVSGVEGDGGGGGAGGVGQDGTTAVGGDGGVGLTYSINGTSVCYAGGGGGGTDGGGSISSATCGGGAGGRDATVAIDGIDGLGGGGGGGGSTTSDGGSGVVIVRYLAGGIAPAITLNTPANDTNSNISNLTFNCSATDNNAVLNLSLMINDIINYTVTNSSANENLSLEINLSLADGNYNWTCNAFNNEETEGTTETRIFYIDSKVPIINVISPRGTIDYHLSGNNLTLNWTVTDQNLGNCWFNYNSTNTTLTCGDNNYSFATTSQTNLTFYANDTLGNKNSNFTSWDYKVLEISQTFLNQTIEGTSTNFTAEVILGSGLTISQALFIYSNQTAVGVTSTQGENTSIANDNFIIPEVNATQILNFTWQLTLSDSSIINLSSQNQTVLDINFDDCSANNNTLFNFTIIDEENQNELSNTTLELAINLFSLDRSILVANLSQLFNNINPVTICLNINISSGTTYLLDLISRYEAGGYANEYYNIVNSSIDNETQLQNIFLYDLNSSDSTDFQVTFTGSDFVAVEGALINLKRQYISENVFKTVELPLTDANGQTILHLVRNDVIYTIEVTKGNSILGTFKNIIAFCEDFTIGDCRINLNAFSSSGEVFNYNEEIGIIFTKPNYDNATRIISFDFVSSDGTVKEVNMSVTRNDIFGNTTICNNSLTSSGGTLSCIVPSYIEDSTLNIKVLVDGKLSLTDTVILVVQGFGAMGYFIFFIYLLTFMLMFSSSKTGMLVGILSGFILSLALGLINGKMIGVGASGGWLIAIVLLMIWKLNKEEQK